MRTQIEAIAEIHNAIRAEGYQIAMTDDQILRVIGDYGNHEIVAMNWDMLAGMTFERAVSAWNGNA